MRQVMMSAYPRQEGRLYLQVHRVLVNDLPSVRAADVKTWLAESKLADMFQPSTTI